MLKIIFDVEATGINPYCDEIIEAYFVVKENNKKVDEYLLQTKVINWSIEAAEIHKIPLKEVESYPDKTTAYREFLKWLPDNFYFTTYANLNTMLGIVNYDYAILWNELNLQGMPNYFLENSKGMAAPVSVHPLARELGTQRLYNPVKYYKDKGLYAQENVYYSLFGETYDAHRAKPDAIALDRIEQELLRLKNENRNFLNWH